MANFCCIGIVDAGNKRRWETADEWLDNESFDTLEKCGNAVLDSLAQTDVEAEVKN